MKVTGAAVALAILLCGVGSTTRDAEARTPDNRTAKPSTRTAAAPAPSARPAAAAPSTRQRGANATQRSANQRHNAASGRMVAVASRSGSARRGGGRDVYAGGYGGGISCVPYARQATGMAISGNGGQWFYNAAGLYARGNRPETGSVMVFPGYGGMRAGHVAVVERVVSPREILIHHANWGGPGIRRGSIMRGVSVVDASPNNDWTQVRVQVGYSNENYGRTYPVHGFIHNRPDVTGGAMFAGTTRLQGGAAQAAAYGLEEVAQAPYGRNTRR